jgi:hypothetical protein
MFNQFILFFMLFGSLLRAQEQFPGLTTVEQAKDWLKTTQPHPMECINVMLFDRVPSPGSKESIDQANIYRKQFAAINLLIEDKSPDDIAYLIPYLSYTINSTLYVTSSTHGISLEGAKNNFPVFAAMFNIPKAASVLASYCLDGKNPVGA